MSIIKNDNNINEININNKKIASIYYGNILVYSSLNNIEIVFRDIDENSNLTLATGSINGLFDNIKTISKYGLAYAFNDCTGITGNVSFPKLTSIGIRGLYYAFNGCTGITGNVSFPALMTVDGYGLSTAFSGCTGITSVSFPALTTVGGSGLNYAFRKCTGITSVSFPVLKTVDSWGLAYAFDGCTGITAIHFRADAQSIIESQTSYTSKFGASNATIYFDL